MPHRISRRYVLLYRQLMLVLGASLVLLWVSVAWICRQTELQALEQSRRETAALAMAFAKNAAATFRGVDLALVKLRQTWLEQPAALERESRSYDQLLDGASLQVAVIDAKGYLAYSNLGMPKTPSFLGDREHFKVHQDGAQDKLFVSRPLKGRVSGKWSIQLTRPILDGARFAGVIVISIDPSYFVRYYEEVELGQRGAVRMIRDSGEIMARSAGQDKFVGMLIRPSPYADPGAPQTGSFRRKGQADGIERLSSYYRLPQYGVSIVIGPSVDELLAPVRGQQRDVVLTGAMVTLLMLFMARQLQRSIERTERAQQHSQEQEERLSLATLHNGVGIWDWNLLTQALIWDDSMYALYHIRREDFAGTEQAWRASLHPQDLERADREVQAALAGEKPFDTEFRVCWPDGEVRHIKAVAKVFRDEQGRALRMVGSNIDVTERVQLEQRLRQRMQELRAILDNSSVGISMVKDRKLVWANRRMAELFGYAVNDSIGQDTLMFYETPQAYELFAQQAYPALARGERYATEMTLRRSDGRPLAVGISGQAIDAAHLDLGSIWVVEDISERKKGEAAIRKAERYARSLIESSLDPLVTISPDGKITDVNQATVDATGRAREALVGSDFSAYFTEPERARAGYLEVFLRGLVRDYPLALRHASGATIKVLYNASVYRNEEGRVEGVFAAARDITERERNEERLRLAASVFTHAREGIIITDEAGTIVDVNEAFCRITGYSREEALGGNPRLLRSDRHPPEFFAAMWGDLDRQGYWSGEIWNRRKSGEAYAEMLTISAVRDDAGKTQNYVALFTDITPMKESAQRLEHIAHYDVLTDLPNRALLADRLQQAMALCQRRGRSLAVAFIDLDGFKAVNDMHGHEIGDELLIALGGRMKAALREGDTLARVGGDEFVAVLVDLEQFQDCKPMLERLLRAAGEPLRINGIELKVSASIGVTLHPRDGTDADGLLRNADQAMYRAKQTGRNRYVMFDAGDDPGAGSGGTNARGTLH